MEPDVPTRALTPEAAADVLTGPEAAADGAESPRKEESAPRPRSRAREYAEAILVAVIFALFTRTFLFQAFQVPTASMEKNILVGVVAVPADNAQRVADDLVASGVRIIFNYSEALLDVPQDVAVHTSNPAVELLYALYFYLT